MLLLRRRARDDVGFVVLLGGEYGALWGGWVGGAKGEDEVKEDEVVDAGSA